MMLSEGLDERPEKLPLVPVNKGLVARCSNCLEARLDRSQGDTPRVLDLWNQQPKT